MVVMIWAMIFNEIGIVSTKGNTYSILFLEYKKRWKNILIQIVINCDCKMVGDKLWENNIIKPQILLFGWPN